MKCYNPKCGVSRLDKTSERNKFEQQYNYSYCDYCKCFSFRWECPKCLTRLRGYSDNSTNFYLSRLRLCAECAEAKRKRDTDVFLEKILKFRREIREGLQDE